MRRVLIIGGSVGGLLAVNMLHSVGWEVGGLRARRAFFRNSTTIWASR